MKHRDKDPLHLQLILNEIGAEGSWVVLSRIGIGLASPEVLTDHVSIINESEKKLYKSENLKSLLTFFCVVFSLVR